MKDDDQIVRAENAAWWEEEARFQKLAARCESISLAHGFAKTTWENLPANLMFIVTEVDEAFHAPTRDAFYEELADIAIRILVHLHALWGPCWSLRRAANTARVEWPYPGLLYHPHLVSVDPTVGLRLVINRVCEAAKSWRLGHGQVVQADVRVCLEQALAQCLSVTKMCGIDAQREIDAKCAKNEGRPHLHGRLEVIG
jgi:NTP pyrophosphatase (non-canonical NTP hydrolase)